MSAGLTLAATASGISGRWFPFKVGLYNVEPGRYTLATGEPPWGFARTPPGPLLWAPLAILSFYLAFVLGGWAVSAGSSLFTIFTGRANQVSEIQTVRYMAIALMVLTLPILAVGRRIERTLEAVQGLFLPYILIGLLLVSLVVVPVDFWASSLLALITPARPPVGTDVSLLGALAGFAALASGLNYMFIGYYRDKGYGMGARVGFIPGLIGGGHAGSQSAAGGIAPVGGIGRGFIRPNGVTFPEDMPNAARWKRWFRFLLIDQWMVYFPGALAGMLLPAILVGYLIITSSASAPDQNSIIVYAATQLSERYGPILGSWALIVGFVVLFSTQIAVLELLARNLTDAAFGLSKSVQRWTDGDPRRVYYPLLVVLVVDQRLDPCGFARRVDRAFGQSFQLQRWFSAGVDLFEHACPPGQGCFRCWFYCLICCSLVSSSSISSSCRSAVRLY
jgi:hypothetical protein